MVCIRGKSICETCGKEFEWLRHDSQPPARFCNRKCTNRDLGVKGNAGRFFWPNATKEQKIERCKEFFNKKVIRKEGCWDWKGCVDKNGYPQIYGHNGKRSIPIKAHRFSYEIHIGKIPTGMIVCHTCDNTRCTNPEHLWIGMPKDNSEDRVKKGRSSKGENRPLSKLKDEDIKEIRKMLALGVTVAFLSRKYKVSYMAVQNVKLGKTWKHVI